MEKKLFTGTIKKKQKKRQRQPWIHCGESISSKSSLSLSLYSICNTHSTDER